MLRIKIRDWFSDLIHWSRQDENRNVVTGVGVAWNILYAVILIVIGYFANAANRKNTEQANLINEEKKLNDVAMLEVNNELKLIHDRHLEQVERMIAISEKGVEFQEENLSILRRLETGADEDLQTRINRRLVVALSKVSWNPREIGGDVQQYKKLETKRVRQIPLSLEEIVWILEKARQSDPLVTDLLSKIEKSEQAEIIELLAVQLQIDNEDLLFPAVRYCYVTRSNTEEMFRNYARVYTQLCDNKEITSDSTLVAGVFEGKVPSVGEVDRFFSSCLENPKLKAELSNILGVAPEVVTDPKVSTVVKDRLLSFASEVAANERLRLRRFGVVAVDRKEGFSLSAGKKAAVTELSIDSNAILKNVQAVTRDFIDRHDQRVQ